MDPHFFTAFFVTPCYTFLFVYFFNCEINLSFLTFNLRLLYLYLKL